MFAPIQPDRCRNYNFGFKTFLRAPVIVAGLLIDRIGKLWAYPLGMVLGTAVLYFFGTAWFCLLSGTAIIPALAACVLPFLPGDAVKIACASVLGSKLRAVADKSPANRL